MWIGHLAKGVDPHDIWCWPGCGSCHRGLQHFIGEPAFWHGRLKIFDPPRFILETYSLVSVCPRTVAFAREVYSERYPNV
jgi:hypothetical protein